MVAFNNIDSMDDDIENEIELCIFSFLTGQVKSLHDSGHSFIVTHNVTDNPI